MPVEDVIKAIAVVGLLAFAGMANGVAVWIRIAVAIAAAAIAFTVPRR